MAQPINNYLTKEPKMEQLVQIRKFSPVGEDPRGLTAEFCLPRKQNEFIFITRKAGTLSGNTYHEGKSSATNPKMLILLAGKIIFSYRKIGTDKKYSEEISEPVFIEISPHVTHSIEGLSDFVMLECNSINDIQNDRIKENV